jgi:glutamine synthetase
MFVNLSEVIDYICDHEIQMIDLKYVNLYGGWHHITLPAARLNEEAFLRGIPFDGSSTPGFKTTEAGDMVLIPDPRTAYFDPFWEIPTLSLFCGIAEADTREPFARDPRSIADRAEAYLRDTGIATHSHWSPEFEFYIFDSVNYTNNDHQAIYSIDSISANWNTHKPEDKNISHRLGHHGGYHAAPPMDTAYNLRSEMVSLLEHADIPVRYHHHEVGGPGQNEIEIMLDSMRRSADKAMWTKYIIKMVCHRHGKTATFMPKPLYGVAGSGMHFHQHLFKGNAPLFYEKGGYADLSETAMYYIGGLLKHGPALLALTNPSTNSYKRLVPGFEAPVRSFFSLGNRSAAIRIMKYATEPMEKRIEFRPPDATGNIYLSMSAQLMAGIDGIINKIDPREEGFGPYDVNVFSLPPEERDKIAELPTNLQDALIALEKDHDFLLKGDVFSEDMIQTWIKQKRKEEVELLRRPHPYEMEMYYEA